MTLQLLFDLNASFAERKMFENQAIGVKNLLLKWKTEEKNLRDKL